MRWTVVGTAGRLLGVAAASLGVLALGGPAAASVQERGFEREFASPSADVRPSVDWFLPGLPDMTAEELRREVPTIAAAGIGSADLFDVEIALSAGQNDLLKTALEAAKRHGITLDLTLGEAFPPVGVPSITPDSPAAQQELVYGTTRLIGGEDFSGPVPEPAEPNPERPATLVAVVAARCATTCTGPKPVLLDQNSLVDLTDSAAAGELTWTAPADGGNWILFGFWRRATQTPYGDYFSPLGTKAVTEYWDEHIITPEIESLLDEAGDQVYEDSLHLEGLQLWTTHLLREFEQRRDYSLRKYLPVTFIPYINDWFIQTFMLDRALDTDSPADFDFPGEAGKRIRNDYYQTLSELYQEHHLAPLGKWARSHGLRYRAKPSYGQTFDISAAAETDVPNTESFGFGNQLDGYRAMTGAVHLGHRDRLAFECCPTSTRVGHDLYSSTWQQMLPVIHGGFAIGANQLMLHGFAYQRSPDGAWPGVHWPFRGSLLPPVGPLGLAEPLGPNMPYWEHMPDINAFLGREQLVLRKGEPRVDVAIYRHSFWSQGFAVLANHTPRSPWFKDKGLERGGFSYEFVGPALLERPNARVHRGRLDPHGPAYKALIIDVPQQRNRVDGMPLTAARRILEFARGGLPVVVVGDTPDRTGFFGDRADDPAVRAVLARLLATPGVLRVSTEAEVPEALERLGVRAGFEPRRPSNVIAARRSSDDAELYFLYNQIDIDNITGEPRMQPAAFDQAVSLAGDGQPYELDPWTGEITPIALYRRGRGRIVTRVRLAPGETTIIAISRGGHDRPHAVGTTADEVRSGPGGSLRIRDTAPGTYRTRLSTGRTAAAKVGPLPAAKTLTGWHLTVEDWRPGAGPGDIAKVRHELDLSTLETWPEIAELQDVSGIGRYTTRIRLGSDWVDGRRGARLELGPLFDSVRVKINGRRLPAVDRHNAVLDVTRYLRSGVNTVEVEVATTLRNRLRTLDEYAEFASAERQPYGLVGPVRLIPYGEAPIRTG